MAKKFNNEQARLKPLMDGLAKSFALTGTMSDIMYNNQLDLIDEELRAMKLIHKDLDVEYHKRLRIIALERKRTAPKRAAHEAVAEDIGKVTPWLREDRIKIAGEEAAKKATADPVNREKYEKQLAIKLIEIDRQQYAGRIEAGKKHFDAIGIASQEYRTLAIEDINRLQAKALIAYPTMEKEINATFARMRRNQEFAWQAPQMADYGKIYSKLGVMDEKHYQMKKERLDAEYSDMQIRLGKSAELQEWYIRSLMAFDVQRLQSSNDTIDGMKAGFERLYLETQPLAKMMADDWAAGFQALEQSAKDLFSEIMSGTQSLTEAVANMGKVLQKMLNEMLFNFIKKGIFDQIYEKIAKIGGGKAKISATKTESAERVALTTIISAQTVKVLALAAAYRVLAAAKSGMGGLYSISGQTYSSSGGVGTAGTVNLGGSRAAGGPVHPDKAYVVGEKGPEVLQMGTKGGNVIPFGGKGASVAPPNVHVVVQNNTGVEADAKIDQPEFDGEKWVLNVFMDAYDRNRDGMRDIMGG
jgi:hypothetical protein